jgi:SRSO17 transposase
VLADSMYGESWDFTNALECLGLSYVVAIRSNHKEWVAPGERVRQTRWRPFDRVFTDGTSERRYRCEFVFGHRTQIRFFGITTDPVHLPPESTWTIMTNLPGKIERTVGNTFGLRTWIEIVCTQMTKTHLLSLGRERNDVANLYFPVGHHHSID